MNPVNMPANCEPADGPGGPSGTERSRSKFAGIGGEVSGDGPPLGSPPVGFVSSSRGNSDAAVIGETCPGVPYCPPAGPSSPALASMASVISGGRDWGVVAPVSGAVAAPSVPARAT